MSNNAGGNGGVIRSMENEPSPTSVSLDESAIETDDVYIPDLINRPNTIIESFSLFKGTGSVYILFECFPIWLLAISPLSFKYVCFVQYESMKEILEISQVTSWIMKEINDSWLPSCFLFKNDLLPSPNFICISGTSSFLKSIKPEVLKAPAVFSFECSSQGKNQSSLFKFCNYRHFLNGGCSTKRIYLGFSGLDPPSNLTCVERSIGDFLDYSNLESKCIPYEAIKEQQLLTPSMVWKYSNNQRKVALPSPTSHTGWITRDLHRKELLDMWGWARFINSPLGTNHILTFTPIQPLCLIVNSYLKRSPPSVSHMRNTMVLKSKLVPSTTTFPTINVTINHDWTKVSVTKDKSDQAPVPSGFWDERLKASFPGQSNIMSVVACLRSLCLCQYRKRLTSSLLTYLRMTFPSDWANFLSGDRSSRRGVCF